MSTAPAVRSWAWVRGRLRDEGPAAARVLVIGAVAWQVTVWAGARNPPVYAVFAPLMALRSDPFSSLTAVALRVVGVIAGVALGLSVVSVLTPSLAALVVVLGLALLIGTLVGPGPALNPQVGLTSLLVLSNPAPDAYGITRLWETALGGLVTIVLAPFLWPPHPYRELTALARECAERLPAALMGSVAALGDPVAAADNRRVVAAEVERLRHARVRAGDAERAMRFNPLRRKYRTRVADLAARLRTVAGAASYVDLLAVEAEVLSARDGASPALRRAGSELPAVVEATGRVLAALVAGGDADGEAEAARRLLDRYRHQDPQAVAVALRRPFHRVLDACVPPRSGSDRGPGDPPAPWA
ncbi:FUSC family protein [Streptomyces sp. NPDC086023]|uniref:FUSC family protein n=1 Tax=Streptomyces sp. NPDC086023 TaxID=3365746 RepID=UPI0037D92100